MSCGRCSTMRVTDNVRLGGLRLYKRQRDSENNEFCAGIERQARKRQLGGWEEKGGAVNANPRLA
jgi:hypothetical protein